jgi:hypothetical protein
VRSFIFGGMLVVGGVERSGWVFGQDWGWN